MSWKENTWRQKGASIKNKRRNHATDIKYRQAAHTEKITDNDAQWGLHREVWSGSHEPSL